LRLPGPLSERDWQDIQKHPELGASMLRECESLACALPVVLHHHERFDGRGYPNRLEGEATPLPARIFAVVDAYDAMTQGRPYSALRSDEQARQEIEQSAGGQFDPAVVEAFLQLDSLDFRKGTMPPRLVREL
jgi:HD-GYP domain-containing protein (c-di-GMP phosphodiesterase class II)